MHMAGKVTTSEEAGFGLHSIVHYLLGEADMREESSSRHRRMRYGCAYYHGTHGTSVRLTWLRVLD